MQSQVCVTKIIIYSSHTLLGEAQGFCLFNNVAIATRSVQKEFPDIKRVMILDWDVHHGNGIQRAFYDDPNVLYVSIHRHDNGRFYPSGDYGAADKCGDGLGIGRWVIRHSSTHTQSAETSTYHGQRKAWATLTTSTPSNASLCR